MMQDIQDLLDERKRTMQDFSPDWRAINMYAIIREDLSMDAGKRASQIGHAFVDAYDAAKLENPDIASLYKGSGHGTKVCMFAKNLNQLLKGYRECRALKIPCALIIDRKHVLPPHFNGDPIITAIGIGPAYKDVVAHITKLYRLIK